MSGRLSVCVIACNEEADLARCLASVDFADEVIVVVDAKSTDRTEEVARSLATRVEVRPYVGDVDQKSRCTSLATGDWVLVIDPDEVMPTALAEELRAAVADGGDGCDGFELNRRTFHLGRWIEHGDFYPDWTLRLFRRGCERWEGESPHGRLRVAGSVGRFEHDLEHYSYRDLADQVERIQDFSAQAARSMYARGRRARVSDLALRPPARFLRGYLLRRGFLDGVPGLVIAAASAFHVLLKYAKLWELERRSLEPGPADEPGR